VAENACLKGIAPHEAASYRRLIYWKQSDPLEVT